MNRKQNTYGVDHLKAVDVSLLCLVEFLDYIASFGFSGFIEWPWKPPVARYGSDL
jgi:hypothetical protein